MARLRITPRSAQVIAAWKEGATAKDCDLVDEVLTTFDDRRTWARRWHCSDYPANRRIKVIQPRDGLWVFVKFPIGAVDIVSISYGEAEPSDDD